jgi:hypothetical protein
MEIATGNVIQLLLVVVLYTEMLLIIRIRPYHCMYNIPTTAV